MGEAELAEADWATGVFHAALAGIGARAAASALRAWTSVPVSLAPAGMRQWVLQSRTITENTGMIAYRVALAYYQLTRSLLTGSVLQVDGWPATAPTLDEVRERFASLTGQTYTETGRTDADRRLGLDRLDGIAEETEAARRAMWDQVDRILNGLHLDHARETLDGIDTDRPAREVDAARTEIHGRTGAAQAATTARLAMNGGRAATWGMLLRDNKALGYARVSRSGRPCGWCAMLISRGASYKTAASAWKRSSDGNRYHDNCRCIGVPIFDPDAYDASRFDQNRELEKLWPQVTRGLSGAAARRAWNEFIKTKYAPVEAGTA
jgi:hypothetical protein